MSTKQLMLRKLKKRDILKDKLFRFSNFICNINQDNYYEIPERLSRCELLLDEFNQIQSEIECLDNSESQRKVKYEFQDNLLKTVSKAKQIITEYSSNTYSTAPYLPMNLNIALSFLQKHSSNLQALPVISDKTTFADLKARKHAFAIYICALVVVVPKALGEDLITVFANHVRKGTAEPLILGSHDDKWGIPQNVLRSLVLFSLTFAAKLSTSEEGTSENQLNNWVRQRKRAFFAVIDRYRTQYEEEILNLKYDLLSVIYFYKCNRELLSDIIDICLFREYTLTYEEGQTFQKLTKQWRMTLEWTEMTWFKHCLGFIENYENIRNLYVMKETNFLLEKKVEINNYCDDKPYSMGFYVLMRGNNKGLELSNFSNLAAVVHIHRRDDNESFKDLKIKLTNCRLSKKRIQNLQKELRPKFSFELIKLFNDDNRYLNLITVQKPNEKLSQEVNTPENINKVKPKNPSIKISNIDLDFTSSNLIDAIQSQNNLIGEEYKFELKVFKKCRRGNSYFAVIECNGLTSEKLIGLKTVNIGLNKCPVYENINIVRCFKCKEFNHKSDDCKNNDVCFGCAKIHTAEYPCSNDKKCINCHRHNQEFKTNYELNHSVYDTYCPVYEKNVKLKTK